MKTLSLSPAGFESPIHPDFLQEIGKPYRNLSRVRLVREQDAELEELELKSSSQVYNNFIMMFGDELQTRERFFVVFLDRKNSPLSFYELGTGGVDWCSADIRLLFCAGLLSLASSIIIMHNHPSGKLAASDQDKTITKKIKEVGDLIGIKLLDHIIFTKNDYYSFIDNGLITF